MIGTFVTLFSLQLKKSPFISIEIRFSHLLKLDGATRWKTANVTPLFKQGAASDPSNYRPISVLPVVSLKQKAPLGATKY